MTHLKGALSNQLAIVVLHVVEVGSLGCVASVRNIHNGARLPVGILLQVPLEVEGVVDIGESEFDVESLRPR